MSGEWGDALERQNAALRAAIAVVDQLAAIALAGADVEEMRGELAAALGRVALVYDRDLALVGAARPDGDPVGGDEIPDLVTPLAAVRESRRPVRIPGFGAPEALPWVVVPIVGGDAVLGFLAVQTIEGEDADLELVTVQHAASVYALALMQTERDAALRARFREELVEGLLLGHVEGAQARDLARLAGVDPDRAYVVVLVEAHAATARARRPHAEVFAPAITAIERGNPDAVAVVRTGGLTVLAPAGDRAGAVGGTIQRVLVDRLGPTGFVAGASRPVTQPEQFARGAAEAQRALAVAQRLGRRGRVVSDAELGVHRLLLHVPPAELDAFLADVLGPLLNEGGGRAALLETLAVYLGENANLRRTADALFVHVNTVTYRLRRIESLLQISLTNSDDRLVAQLATELARTRGLLGAPPG